MQNTQQWVLVFSLFGGGLALPACGSTPHVEQPDDALYETSGNPNAEHTQLSARADSGHHSANGESAQIDDNRRTIPPNLGLDIVLQVPFAPDAPTFLPQYNDVIEEIARRLNEHPEIADLEIRGHADGSERHPIEVSLSRANGVRNALVRLGVDSDRMVVKGVGSSQPVDDNATPRGRAHNRRVDFHRTPEKSTSAAGE